MQNVSKPMHFALYAYYKIQYTQHQRNTLDHRHVTHMSENVRWKHEQNVHSLTEMGESKAIAPHEAKRTLKYALGQVGTRDAVTIECERYYAFGGRKHNNNHNSVPTTKKLDDVQFHFMLYDRKTKK